MGKKLQISSSRIIPLWVIGVHIAIIFGMGIFQQRAPQTFVSERFFLKLRDALDDGSISKVSKQTQGMNVVNSYHAQTIAQEPEADDPSTSTPTPKTFRDRDIFLNPKPIYPLLSRRMREQGAVHIKLCVDWRGHVESVWLIKSSGYQNLDRSAMDGVRSWKFSTLEPKDQAISHCYHLPVHFRLET